jgi:glycosyltransferase involved in cell wall biosynthesis
MRIAFFISSIENGGAENSLIRLADELHIMGFEITLIAFTTSMRSRFLNYKFISLDSNSHTNFLQKLCTFFRRLKRLIIIKKQNNFDFVVSFLTNANILNVLSKVNEKVILSVRNHQTLDLKNKKYSLFYSLAIKILYNKSNGIVCVTKSVMDDLKTNFKIKDELLKVIYNGYPINQITKMANSKLSDQEKILFNQNTIISIGRLTTQKGHSFLIDSFSILKKSFNEYKLVIVGEGELREALEDQILNLGLSDSVFLYGKVDNPYKLLKNSKLFVLTSLYEGYPNVLCEAIIVGTNSIVTNSISGPSEILLVDNHSKYIKTMDNVIYAKNGTLVPNFTSSNNTDSLKILAREMELHMKIINKTSDMDFINEVSITNIAQIWEKYFKSFENQTKINSTL